MRVLIYTLLCLPFLLNAQTERFNDFRATIELDADGKVMVTENIRATAAGNQIKRGITRPLRRKRIGNDVNKASVDYEVISATRDGATERFHTKSKSGYRTVYLGSKDHVLDPGTYAYELHYTSTDRIYFTETTNEFRWSIFSSDLRLPVDAASVELVLPAGLDVLTTACFTGGTGSEDQSACEVVRSGNRFTFTLKRPLPAGQGLNIAAAFPTGSFYQAPPPPPPTPLQQNGTLWFCLAGVLTALAYGYTTWQKYGVDPPAPEVRHQYTPPRDHSPASLAYLNSGFASQHQLTASLTALAVGGYLKIDEEERSSFFSKRDIFIIRPQDKDIAPDLPAEQVALYSHLKDAGTIELDGEFNEFLKKATDLHHESLREQHSDYLKQGRNGWKVLPFALILLGAILLSLFFAKHAGTEGIIALVGAGILLTVGSGIFAWLIRQPSQDKVNLWAEIKGLKQYLKLKEKGRKALPNAPEMNKEYFQSILPYAIALGIENDWAADLAADLAGTINRDNQQGVYLAPYLNTGFGGRMNTAYGAVATPASSGGGGSIGGGGVSGGGGGSGGW